MPCKRNSEGRSRVHSPVTTVGRRHLIERACQALVLSGVVASGALVVAIAAAFGWYRIHAPDLTRYAFDKETLAALLAVLVTFALARSVLAGGSAFRHVALFAALALNLACAEAFLLHAGQGIAHSYGIHGRMGFGWDDMDCAPAYWVRNDTLPFLLFGPSLLGVAAHGILRRLQRRRGSHRSHPA
jgi:hypothetical protein